MTHIPPRARGELVGHDGLQPSLTRAVSAGALRFTYTEAASGAVLIVAIVLALIWANSPWRAAYAALWTMPVTIGAGPVVLSKPLLLWINEGLMTLFFFVVGLEIKRELLHGELASARRAALPAIGALGGMLVPAGLYLAVAGRGPGASGWGVPMATDIAITLGVLALLGSRVPAELRVWLLGLAIIDDLGAIVVIAIFYSHGLSLPAMVIAAGLFGLLALAVRLGLHSSATYLVLSVAFWVAMLASGIHATIAGVFLAILVPATARVRRDRVAGIIGGALDRLEQAVDVDEAEVTLGSLKVAVAESEPALDRLERLLHRWVSFGIVPLFALANAGVELSGPTLLGAVTSPIALGIAVGLVLGKPAGIVLASWIAVRLRLAILPGSVGWRELAGGGILAAGIGFTVALFIAELAFSDPALLAEAKVGILVASIAAGVAGIAFLRLTVRAHRAEPKENQTSSSLHPSDTAATRHRSRATER